MRSVLVYIKPNEIYSKPIEYVLELISKNQQIRFIILNEKANSEIIFDIEDKSDKSVPIAGEFYTSLLSENKFNFEHYFRDNCFIHDIHGSEDLIASIFYMVNCFQEFGNNRNTSDKFGRFAYEQSYQYRFKNIQENLVQQRIEKFCMDYIEGHSIRSFRTRIFVSHDIDTINGALIQDGFWALKNKRFDVIIKLIINYL